MSIDPSLWTRQKRQVAGPEVTAAQRRLSTAGTTLYWLGLISPALIPILFPYLPYQDWPGHVGVVAAQHWLSVDPGALPEPYASRGWMGPNRLAYALAGLLVPVFGVLGGSNLLLAIFLGLLGPALHFTIRALGGDPRWSLAAVALTHGRVLACGFGPNAMAMAPAIFALGLGWRADRWRYLALLAATLLVTLGLHLFVFLVISGLLGLIAVIDLLSAPTRRRGLSILGVIALALITMRVVAELPVDPRYVGPGAIETVIAALQVPKVSDTADALWTWLFAFHRRGFWDDMIQGLWAGALILGVGLAIAPGSRRAAEKGLLLRLFVLIAAVTVAFVVLPAGLGPPINWWGGNLRLPTFLAVLMVIVASTARGRGASMARAATSAASLAFLLGTSSAIYTFNTEEMGGFSQVIEAIPSGRKVCSFHYSPDIVHEFPGEPHWYAGNYYLARQPGAVDQSLFSNPGVPVSQPHPIPAQGWGIGLGFRWKKHSRWCDGFLVRVDQRDPTQPFSGQTKPECVTLKSAHGNWRYYEKPPGLPDSCVP